MVSVGTISAQKTLARAQLHIIITGWIGRISVRNACTDTEMIFIHMCVWERLHMRRRQPKCGPTITRDIWHLTSRVENLICKMANKILLLGAKSCSWDRLHPLLLNCQTNKEHVNWWNFNIKELGILNLTFIKLHVTLIKLKWRLFLFKAMK